MKKKNKFLTYMAVGLFGLTSLCNEAKSQIIKETVYTHTDFDTTLNLGMKEHFIPQIGVEGSFREIHAGAYYAHQFSDFELNNKEITNTKEITGKLGVRAERLTMYFIAGKGTSTKKNLETLTEKEHSGIIHGAGMGININNDFGVYFNVVKDDVNVNVSFGTTINIYGTERDIYIP